MKKSIVLIIKGFIMGIANIIPGVSGGTLALTLGIYEQFISSISHFFKKFKENIKFLLPILIGIVLAIFTMSNLITKCFSEFPLPTSTFFMGLVIGGIPLLLRKVKGTKESKKVSSYLLMLLTFLIVMLLAFSDQIFGSGLDVSLNNINFFGYVILLFVGIIASGTMVIPGVSGSLVLMLLGYYFPILNAIKSLMKFDNIIKNFLVLGFFGVGVLLGMVLLSKLIEYLFSKYEAKTYFGVMGFIFSSILAIPISVYHEIGSLNITLVSVLIGVITLLLGSFIGYKLGEK